MAKPITIRILGDASKFEQALGKTQKGLGTFGKFAIGAAAGVATAIAGMGVAAFKIGQDFDAAYDTIRGGTGATGEALDGLKDTFRGVLKDVPASFEDASTAVADLNTRLGITGKPLQDLSGQMINLSRITGEDLGTNIESVTRVFGDFGVAAKNQGESLDKLFLASQATGIGVGDLAAQMTSFGSPLRQLGFGFEQSAALIAKFEKEGVNAEAVLGGMKQSLGKMAKAGEEPIETFQRLSEEIANAGSTGEANAIAVEAFGSRAGPDLAAAIREGRFELDDLIATMEAGGDSINGAAADTESFGEKWTKIKNRVLLAVEPVAMRVFDGMGDAMDYLSTNVIPAAERAWQRWGPVVMDYVQRAKDAVERAFQAIALAVDSVKTWISENEATIQGWVLRIQEIIAQLSAAFSSAFAAVQAIVSTAVAILTELWNRFGANLLANAQNAWAGIVQVLQGAIAILTGIFDLITAILTGKWGAAWDAIKKILSGAWQAIQGIVTAAVSVLSNAIGAAMAAISAIWSVAWNAIETLLSDIWDGIKALVSGAVEAVRADIAATMGAVKGAWSAAWGAVKGALDGIIGGIRGAVDGLVGFISGVPGRVAGFLSSIWNPLGTAFDRVVGGIKRGWNSFASFWNGLSLSVPKVDIPGLGSIGGGSISLPPLPRFAKGAVLTEPTVGLMAEYPGARTNPEIVTPERKMRDVFREVLAEGGGSGPVVIEQHFHGFSTDEAKRLAREGTREALREVRQKVRSL